jgi:cobalt-zinc-cadmium efflux system membrane fusion protein
MTQTTAPGHAYAPRPPKSTRQWTLLAGAAVAALALFFGVPLIGKLFEPKPPPPPAAPPPGTFAATPEQWATLQFLQVKLQPFHAETETDGKIAVDDDLTTQVFSPFSGRVTRVFAQVGEQVRAGQPLLAIVASEALQAQSDLTAAIAQEKLATANEARQHALYQASGAALKDWQQSQADLAAAQAALQAVRNRLKVLGGDDGATAPTAGAANGQTVVSAPIAGVVTQRNIGVGQNIGSVTNGGATPAFVISNLSKVWLAANVREADSSLAKPGQLVDVRVAALPGRLFKAHVDYVSPTVDPATHRVTVRATLDNPDHLLKPEMFADFGVATGADSSSIGVPEDAVIFEGDTARVWVAKPSDKTLELRQIKAGDVVDGQVQVLSGLSPGEWVVSSGALFIDRAAKPD